MSEHDVRETFQRVRLDKMSQSVAEDGFVLIGAGTVIVNSRKSIQNTAIAE